MRLAEQKEAVKIEVHDVKNGVKTDPDDEEISFSGFEDEEVCLCLYAYVYIYIYIYICKFICLNLCVCWW